MATLGNSFIDLIDLYKQQDGKGGYIDIIDMLTQLTPMLDDAIAIECNKGSRHLHAIRTGLPSVSWGQFYKGIPQSKSAKANVEDTTGYVEGLSTIDTRILEISKNEGAIRLQEGESFLEAMAQEAQNKLIYGNTASDPEQIFGLAPRFNDLAAPNASQIIDAGGTSQADNTSIWFVTWGPGKCHLIYPQGTKAGVSREDKGEQRVLDASGDPYYVKEELFRWHLGLGLGDWRYVARVANIDVANLLADPSNIDGNGHSLYHFMRKAYYKLHNRRLTRRRNNSGMPSGKLAIYCNRDVLEALDMLGTNSGSSDNFLRLKTMEIQGEEVETYRKIPIRETDAILNTEARVV